MKYTPATIAKALFAAAVGFIGAATAAAHGTDLSVLDLGSWLNAAGVGLVAGGGVFAVPNKTSVTDTPATIPVLASADQAVNSIQETVQKAIEAQAGITQVKKAVDDILNVVPGGSLVEQVLNTLPKL